MREGSTERVASTFRPDACAIFAMMSSASAPAQLARGDQLDLEHALLLCDEPLELAPDLGDLAQPPLLREQAQEVAGRPASASPKTASSPACLARASICGLSRRPRSSGDASTASTKSPKSVAHLVEPPFSFAASNSAFA